MAVAEYITKVELDALETRIMVALEDMSIAIADLRGAMATKADVRDEANRVIEAISHGTNPNF